MVTEGVVADTTILSNFVLIGREDILNKVFRNNFFTTEEVLKELKRGEDRGVIPKGDWGWIKIVKIESPHENYLFQLFTGFLGTIRKPGKGAV